MDRPKIRPFERRKEFTRLRHTEIPSESFLLEPYRGSAGGEHARAALAFRAAASDPRGRHEQEEGASNAEPTLEDQHRWHRDYLDRDDEIVWLLRDYENHLIGSTCLTAIELEHGPSALLGPTVIDRFAADERALAIEAIELVLQIAFENLQLRRVHTQLRASETDQLETYRRRGFRWVGWVDPEDRSELLMELHADGFDPDQREDEAPKTRRGAVAS